MDDALQVFNDTLLINATAASETVSNATSASSDYCGVGLREFTKSYRNIHPYICLIVCFFGAQANILNLIVLTRKEMINPTNAILTGLALADLLNMVEYIPYAMYMILPDNKTYASAVFILIHSNFSQVCHTISIWLTVTLAVWRYIMVAMHTKCKTLCSMERAKWAIASAYVTSPMLCIPIYLSFAITPLDSKPTSALGSSGLESALMDNETFSESNYSVSTTMETIVSAEDKYIVNLSDLAKENPFLMIANFWLYSVVIKIIPCIMLTVVSLRLINSLMEAKKRKDKLLAKRAAPPATTAQSLTPGNNTRAPDHQGDSGGSDRTTRMLLAVLLLFLITEFPQGMMGLLSTSSLLGNNFFKTCYIPSADLMDFVALLNSAINFILYCSMSKKFRDTFSQLFRLNRLMKFGRQRSTGRRTGLAKTAPMNTHAPSPKSHLQLLADREREHLPV